MQTFKEAVMQSVLFEHLFLCDHFEKSICSIVFIKGSSTTYVFLDVFQSFVAAISKHPHEKIYEKIYIYLPIDVILQFIVTNIKFETQA